MDSVFPLNKLEPTRKEKKDIKIVDIFVNLKRNVKFVMTFIQLFIYFGRYFTATILDFTEKPNSEESLTVQVTNNS